MAFFIVYWLVLTQLVALVKTEYLCAIIYKDMYIRTKPLRNLIKRNDL